MRATTFFVLSLTLGACVEQEFSIDTLPPQLPPVTEVSGQVCDIETQSWLEGATVYSHIYDDNGAVYDTVTTTTDAEGKWTLPLPGGLTYQIYVAYRNDLLETFEIQVPDEGPMQLPPPACFGDVELSVAVVTGAYDDLAVLFQAIGIANYREVDGQAGDELVDFLSDPAFLAEYQVVFFDGGHQEEGVIYPVGDPTVDQIHASLKTYVENGGVVFSSDWSYDLVENVWPDRIDFYGDDLVPDAAQLGEPGDVSATVTDDFMVNAIGVAQTTVAYDLAVFPVIEGVGPDTKVYLQGDVPYREGCVVSTVVDSPLAVSFTEGNGRVFYTSYRNSVNGAGDMLGALKYMLGTVGL